MSTRPPAADAVHAYLRQGRGKTGKALNGTSPRNYRRDLAFLAQWAPGEEIWDMGPERAEHFVQWLGAAQGQRITPTGRERVLSVLSGFYAYAAAQGWLPEQPGLGHRAAPGSIPYTGPRLTRQQRGALLDAARAWRGRPGGRSPQAARDRAMVGLMAYPLPELGHRGMREGQIAAADVDRLYLDDQAGPSIRPWRKGGGWSPEPCRLPDEAAAWLREYLPLRREAPGERALFTSRVGKRLSTTDVGPIMHAVAASHPDLRPLLRARTLTVDAVALVDARASLSR